MADLPYQIRDLAQAAEHMASVAHIAVDMDENVLRQRALEASENISKVVQLMSKRLLTQGNYIYGEEQR